MKNLQDQKRLEQIQAAVAGLGNLSDFARYTGVSRRTLNRAKVGANLQGVTMLAIEQALLDYAKHLRATS